MWCGTSARTPWRCGDILRLCYSRHISEPAAFLTGRLRGTGENDPRTARLRRASNDTGTQWEFLWLRHRLARGLPKRTKHVQSAPWSALGVKIRGLGISETP